MPPIDEQDNQVILKVGDETGRILGFGAFQWGVFLPYWLI